MPVIRFIRPGGPALRAGAAALALSAAVTALGAGPASAAPARADLGLTVTPDPARVLVAGQVAGIGVDLVNHGRAGAEGITLTFRLPQGVAPAGEGGIPSDSPWHCVLATPVTTCTHPALAAGAAAAPLKLQVRLPAGRDGGSVTVPVGVTTTSRESATADNADTAVFTYDASIVVPEPEVADLGLTVTPDPERVRVDGQAAGVGLALVNRGNAVADGISLHVRLPDGVTVAGDGGGVPADGPWQCDVSSPVVACTHPALAAGEAAAALTLGVQLPAGADGSTVTVPVDVSTTSAETNSGDNIGDAVFTYDASIGSSDPHGADLRFTTLDVRPYWVVEGDTVRTVWEFENVGDLVAEDVTMRITLDPRLRPVPADGVSAPWQCSTLTDGWDCRHTPMVTGEQAVLPLEFTVVGGGAGDLIPFQGVLTTSTPELPSGANEIGTSVEFADTSTVHGQLWQDLDGDGRRDAEDVAVDPVAANASVWVVPTFAGQPNGTPIAVPVAADGSWTVEVKPNQYRVEVRVAAAYDFTGRDATDDAVDSDVSRYAVEGDEVIGHSVDTYVPNGSDWQVDAGLIRAIS
ncbi:hypothetical protein [Micromonospora sp. MA102]|uniref:hypothetical protein n=1 Tax=Micromonospora sp. MA102 TaxID=2952755 RepID=UPI0021C7D788|nr:hypothetical protein [Micromonospora sp. MA102]